MRARLVILLPMLLALACNRTVSEDDCKKIGDHIAQVWQSESKRLTPSDAGDPLSKPPGADKAASVVASEGERVVADWSAECKKELLGRRVDPKEIDCLMGASTIDELNKCAESP